MYTYTEVKEAIETLYILGYEEMPIMEFIELFCQSERLDKQYTPGEEERRIRLILDQLRKRGKLEIKKDQIRFKKTWYGIPRPDLAMSE